jgi:hypothetical protein
MTTKYAIAKRRREEREARKRLAALFSAAMELPKDDLRAANNIIEEATWGLPRNESLDEQLGPPSDLMTAFERRYGSIGPGRAIPMPPPLDIPSKPDSVVNGDKSPAADGVEMDDANQVGAVKGQTEGAI